MTNRQVNLATSVSRFTESSLHTLANGKEFYGQVILFYLSRMLEKTKPMVNYLMNNLGFGFSVFTVVENQSKKVSFTTLRAETKYFSSNGTILVIFKPLCKCVQNELKVGRNKVF